MLPDTLLVDGVDIATFTGIVVEDLAGLLAPGRRRGEDLTIPGRNGSIPVAGLPYESYAFDLPITVLPDNPAGVVAGDGQGRRAQMLTNLNTAALALAPGVLTLTRRLTLTASTSVDHTCAARFVDGLQLEMLNPETGRTVLQFINLDGCWHDALGAVVVP